MGPDDYDGRGYWYGLAEEAEPQENLRTLCKCLLFAVALFTALAVMNWLSSFAWCLSPSTCRVLVPCKDYESQGTGVYIGRKDGKSIVLTAYHVVEECERNEFGTNIMVVFPKSGETGIAESVDLHPEVDIAVLLFDDVFTVPRRDVNTAKPRLFDRVFNSGFGHKEVGEREGWGWVMNLEATSEHINGRKAPTLSCAGKTRLGDSGGPLCDERGRLIAIVWGGNSTSIAATPLYNQPWLRQYLPEHSIVKR